MSLISGSEQPYTYNDTSQFTFLSHIPDENPTHQVSDHDFVRGKSTSRQLHAPMVKREKGEKAEFHDSWRVSTENMVPHATDFPAQGFHTNNAGFLFSVSKTHDYGPRLPIQIEYEQDRTRFQIDAEKDTRVNMTGHVQDQFIRTGPTERQVVRNMDDKTQDPPRYNHVLHSIDNKGSSKSTIMLTGTREMPMPIRFGGPTTQARGQHRLEESTMYASKHKDSTMDFRPHNEIVESNEMHHMIGEREYGTTAYNHLEQDMLLAFHPRNEHNIYDTYHNGMKQDSDLIVNEPGEWM